MTGRTSTFQSVTIKPGRHDGIVVTVAPEIPMASRGKRLFAPLREDNDYWHGIDEQTQALLFALMVDGVEFIRTQKTGAYIHWHDETITYTIMAERIAFSLRRLAIAGKVDISPDMSLAQSVRRAQDVVWAEVAWLGEPMLDRGVEFQWHHVPQARIRGDRPISRDHIHPVETDAAAADRARYRLWLADQADALDGPARLLVSAYEGDEDGGPYLVLLPPLDASAAQKIARIMAALALDPDLADRILSMMETED